MFSPAGSARVRSIPEYRADVYKRQTGIRPTTISNLYNDVAERIGFDQLDRICEALHCTLYALLEYPPNEHPRTGEQLIRCLLYTSSCV